MFQLQYLNSNSNHSFDVKIKFIEFLTWGSPAVLKATLKCISSDWSEPLTRI